MIDRINACWRWVARRPGKHGGLILLTLGLGSFGILELATAWMPLPSTMAQGRQTSIQVSDRQGEPLRLVRSGEDAFHLPIQLQECGETFLAATLAAEDKRYWEHRGVDWLGLVRVGKEFVHHGRIMSGGSTITQQLIKNSEARPRPRTVRTKLIEILQARKLERRWDKEQIFEAYLNRINYGNLCVGAGTASRFYFNKPFSSLSPAEAALLAGLPNAPSRLNPLNHPERARARQQKILRRMARNGWLSSEELQRALSEPLVYAGTGRTFAAAHFVDFVQQERELAGHVATTLDAELNTVVQEMLGRELDRLSNRRVSNGAVVVIDNPTGDVLALVGSRDYFNQENGQVNGAWAPRSAGSTFKPFTYLMALEAGLTPATQLADVPTEYPTATGVFSPENFDRRYRGPVSLRRALANSLNVPAVRALQQAGGPEALKSHLRQLGLSTLPDAAGHYGLGLTIGNAEARLLELANAYATLGRLGEHRPWRILQTDPTGVQRVFEREESWLMADILSDANARAEAFGEDSILNFPFPVACKTGTSSEFRDNWAFGYTPEYTVGVWVGNFDGSPMSDVSGVTGAAPVMHRVMVHLHETRGTSWFRRPTAVEAAKVNPHTGMRARLGQTEWFRKGTLPRMEAAGDRNGNGQYLLDERYSHWLPSAPRQVRERFALAPVRAREVQILSPQPGMVIYLDPDLPVESRELRLRTTGETAHWRSDTLNCEQTQHGFVAHLKPGRHELVADHAGLRLRTWVQVKER